MTRPTVCATSVPTRLDGGRASRAPRRYAHRMRSPDDDESGTLPRQWQDPLELSAPGGPEPHDDTGDQYGPVRGVAAGKGPVRGFPPSPGQHPPVYPPGQFARWNRARRGPASSADDARQTPTSAWQAEQRQLHQDAPSVEAYEAPDYAVLAVSDPAADVTPTQTWRPIADGRSTGTWISPLHERALANPELTGPGRVPSAGPPTVGGPPDSPATRVPDDAANGAADWLTVTASSRRAEQVAAPSPGLPGAAVPRRPGEAGSRGPRPGITGPRDSRPGRAAPRGARPEAAPPRRGRRAAPPTSPGRQRKRRRSLSVVVVVSCAVIVALGAGAFLAWRLLGHSTPLASSSPPAKTHSSPPSPTPSPTLGPNGHIESRSGDPTPLTVAQLFPTRFSSRGHPVVRTATRAVQHCGRAVVGSALKSAVAAAGCTQAVRATYLAVTGRLMSTIGVLNLRTFAAARRAGRAAGSTDFVARLPGARKPTSRIAHGRGVEEAEVKGHYLILVWVGYTDLRAPHHSQLAVLERFMRTLIRRTANVSLTARMVNGKP